MQHSTFVPTVHWLMETLRFRGDYRLRVTDLFSRGVILLHEPHRSSHPFSARCATPAFLTL